VVRCARCRSKAFGIKRYSIFCLNCGIFIFSEKDKISNSLKRGRLMTEYEDEILFKNPTIR